MSSGVRKTSGPRSWAELEIEQGHIRRERRKRERRVDRVVERQNLPLADPAPLDLTIERPAGRLRVSCQIRRSSRQSESPPRSPEREQPALVNLTALVETEQKHKQSLWPGWGDEGDAWPASRRSLLTLDQDSAGRRRFAAAGPGDAHPAQKNRCRSRLIEKPWPLLRLRQVIPVTREVHISWPSLIERP